MDKWRVSIPALSAAASAGYLFYLLLASVPVSQALTLVPAAEAGPPSAVGQAMATDTPTVVDRLRPSDEDIAKALRRAMENWSKEVHEAVRDSDKLAINGPTALPEERHPAAFAEPHVQLFEEFVRWRKSHSQRQWRVAPSLRGKQVSLGASHPLGPSG